MKKAIIISIQPQWVEKILNEEKTIEIRKTTPNCEMPIDVYIYCTKSDKYHLDWEFGKTTKEKIWFNWNKKSHHYPFSHYEAEFGEKVPETFNGHIVAKFTMSYCLAFDKYDKWLIEEKAKLTKDDFYNYKKNKKEIYGWKIKKLEIFKKPKELSEFGLKRPPQSWQYVEVIK